VFERWARAINAVEKSLNGANFGYAYNEHLGYITTCPSNVGTGIIIMIIIFAVITFVWKIIIFKMFVLGLRASVMLKLPKLYKKLGVHALEELCDNMGLQARGARGEHSPPGPNGEFGQ
jgi:protein-arginine kinase